jgi:phthalate 3,4-cis-dihydrodiol dehydrogenase
MVVGAGSGIGRAVVEAFLLQGARIAAMELDPAKCTQIENAFPGVQVHEGDATRWADADAAVAASTQAMGGLDVLVNCVGLFDFYTGLRDIPGDALDSAFEEAFTTNVRSHLVSVKAALDPLTVSKGSIILTASTSSFYPGRGGVLYVSSKHAVRGAILSLAHELAPDIRVNGVAPGGTLNTDLRGLRTLGLNQRSLGATPGRAEDLKKRTPLAVALTAEDMAGSFVFLASDWAKGMTGEFLHPDGGMAIQR